MRELISGVLKSGGIIPGAYIQWLISRELISGYLYRGKYPGDLYMGNYIWRTYIQWLISED